MSEKFDMGFIANLSGLSPRAKKFFLNMKKPAWNEWRPRYLALLELANGQQQSLSDLTWWEKDFLAAMMLHKGMADRLKQI